MKNTLKMLVGSFFIFSCLFFFATTAHADDSYTVKKGDTLSKLARVHYGDASEWQTIYNANKDVIKNPNVIHIGWKLTLPDKKDKMSISRSKNDREETIVVKATAYDLSIASCGKAPDHPEYGITCSGRSIEGQTRIEAACVAVDPKVIPLGSLLSITFDDPDYYIYNGIYQALDTGGGVRGNHIDVFLGDFESTKPHQEVKNFGITKARVIVLRDGW